MSIPILYENTHMLVINKPAGLVVHSDGRTTEATLADWIIEKYPEIKEIGEPTILSSGETVFRPGIVHRLDRDTSGVLVIAKTVEGFKHLKNQFQSREIKKTYQAFVYGIIRSTEGTIDRPIARSRKDFRLWSAQRGGRGETREAITNYKVLKKSEKHQASFIEAYPLTGRTHQIRVHLKAINHPVVADSLYAPKREPILSFKRLALHALRISFDTQDGKKLEIEAPYPDDFQVALSIFS